jgi:hypothetical protein
MSRHGRSWTYGATEDKELSHLAPLPLPFNHLAQSVFVTVWSGGREAKGNTKIQDLPVHSPTMVQWYLFESSSAAC